MLLTQGKALLLVRKLHRKAVARTQRVIGSGKPRDVHKARVQLRRLRTGLRNFEFLRGGKGMRRVRRSSRRAMTALNRVRDADVFLSYIKDNFKVETIRSGRPGRGDGFLSGFTREISQKRSVRMEEARKALGKFASGHFRFLLPAREKQKVIVLKDILIPVQKRFFKAAGRAVSSGDKENLHRFRMATKRLRYTVEFLEKHWFSPSGDLVNSLKQIQTFLGQLHDRDVWLGRLEKTTSDSRELQKVLTHIRKDRASGWREFKQSWKEGEMKLKKMLRGILIPPRKTVARRSQRQEKTSEEALKIQSDESHAAQTEPQSVISDEVPSVADSPTDNIQVQETEPEEELQGDKEPEAHET